MRSFKRFAFVLFTLFIAAIVVMFVLENNQSVGLLLFGLSVPRFPVSVLVLLALLAGMMIGPLLSWLIVVRRRLK
ncbi:DUF1049 domain-containing protein [Pseudomonas syringae]|nr:DUF1049 domain-containing protein [Pseudomonas syringae]MCF5069936.1 DUF1049 domain-containing protein [Pseudomonas syringae]